MNTPESKSAAYAESKIPNANSVDAPFCTTGDRWEEIREAYLAGYTADRWIPVTKEGELDYFDGCGVFAVPVYQKGAFVYYDIIYGYPDQDGDLRHQSNDDYAGWNIREVTHYTRISLPSPPTK